MAKCCKRVSADYDCTRSAFQRGPIHSKGVGRSGPKRKTGCLTCRRRKVRCDETRPICANCVRLRLDCDYATPKDGSAGSSQRDTTPIQSASRQPSFSASQDSYISDQASIISSGAYMLSSGSTTPYSEEQGMWTVPSHAPVSFDIPIASQPFPSLENFDLNLAFPTNAEAYFSSDSYSSSMNQAATPVPIGDTTFNVPRAVLPSNNGERRAILLEHFSDSINPVSLVEPTPIKWLSARQSILNHSQDCAFLMSGTLAAASLHIHHTTGEDFVTEAIEYYKSASRDVDAILDSPTLDDRQLKLAFAAVFLLVYIELLSQTTPHTKRAVFPLRLVRTFHHRVHQHHHHLLSWSGLHRRLLIWTSLLLTKTEWNSGDIALQHSSSSLKFLTTKSDSDPRTLHTTTNPDSQSDRSDPNTTNRNDNKPPLDLDTADDISTTFTLTYDTLNNPGHDFHLSSQAFTSRILNLHREITTENLTSYLTLETVSAGQKINTDLHALWAARPGTMNLIINADALENILQPELARTIILNLRVYAANFFALLVDLHRSAFAAYPASHDAQTAVKRIIALAREILNDVNRRRSMRTVSPSTSSTRSGATTAASGAESAVQGDPFMDTVGSVSGAEMPAMMLWPLFLAATESSTSERAWILNVLQSMDKRVCPTAVRVVPLLQEVLRRQDEGGVRVDHRAVRAELFGAELGVLF